MGINAEVSNFINACVGNRTDLESVLELGRQSIKGSLKNEFSTAEAFYRYIGFTEYMYLDAGVSGRSLQDLNDHELGWRLQRSNIYRPWYDLVTNLGTGEHVFNQGALFATIHMMCKPGGIMIHAVPLASCGAWSEHAFYTYSEYIFLALVAANQYQGVRKYVTENGLLLVAMARPQRDIPFRVPYDLRYYKSRKVPGYDGQDAPKPIKEIA